MLYVPENNLKGGFPNIFSMRLRYYTLSISNCEAERTDSKLIENVKRSYLHPKKLNLSAEGDVTRKLNSLISVETFRVI